MKLTIIKKKQLCSKLFWKFHTRSNYKGLYLYPISLLLTLQSVRWPYRTVFLAYPSAVVLISQGRACCVVHIDCSTLLCILHGSPPILQPLHHLRPAQIIHLATVSNFKMKVLDCMTIKPMAATNSG